MQEIVEKRVLVEVSILPGNRITRADAARILQVQPRTLYDWEDRGLLTPIRTGGRVFYDYGQVTAHLGRPAI
ncbi:MerR family DNA-binding transcriptional regulator [Hyphomicrobium sp. LHD-15]|uniref:MerR family DNA-binding transcriptional regulator n=1 Tax=Hyphomicrobium sp. LHD-15 TaxID=3072142 RepID=UPI00280D9190|nr:MerR family DNA-binding transcriptional regulator [Hyphomicrobium sp. LHD-15]MDQ8700226.1 MerR family transcriptional regulator [Hyphomicrobium sp. LHD-15]